MNFDDRLRAAREVNTLDKIRDVAAPMFSDPAVDSVNVMSWIGEVRVHRNGRLEHVAGFDMPQTNQG